MARDEVRTRDIHVGNVVLYQLSYSRNFVKNYTVLLLWQYEFKGISKTLQTDFGKNSNFLSERYKTTSDMTK